MPLARALPTLLGDDAAAARVMFVSQVDAGGQLRLQIGIADAVGPVALFKRDSAGAAIKSLSDGAL
jgi:hypothetical protein